MGPSILVLVGVIVAFVLLLIGIISANLFICQPSEVLIFSGRTHKGEGDREIGYRVIKGGRAFRIPFVERVDRMDLWTIPLEISISNAYSKGGIPLRLQGVANVKIAGDEPLLGYALERFLGKSLEEIEEIAKDTLEGNLRGLVASLAPEEVNEDRLKFAQSLTEDANADLQKLGFMLDTLTIQDVMDDVGYLEAIGRPQTAVVVREAEVAEAENRAESLEKSSEARRRGEVAEAQAQIDIVDAQNRLRIRTADLEGEGSAAEKRAEQMARKAQVQAEHEVEEERLALQKRRLEIEVVEPARADQVATELGAKGTAAGILESGLAEVELLKQKNEVWNAAGDHGKELLLIQMLPAIVEQIAAMAREIKIDHLAVVDSGAAGSGGAGVQSVVNQIGHLAPALFTSLKATTGVDVAAALQRQEVPAPPTASTEPEV